MESLIKKERGSGFEAPGKKICLSAAGERDFGSPQSGKGKSSLPQTEGENFPFAKSRWENFPLFCPAEKSREKFPPNKGKKTLLLLKKPLQKHSLASERQITLQLKADTEIILPVIVHGSLRQGGIHYLEFGAGSVYIAHASRAEVFVYF